MASLIVGLLGLYYEINSKKTPMQSGFDAIGETDFESELHQLYLVKALTNSRRDPTNYSAYA